MFSYFSKENSKVKLLKKNKGNYTILVSYFFVKEVGKLLFEIINKFEAIALVIV